MLYVNTSSVARRVALVFSGAQELSAFFEDETSPLGSRAALVHLVNLEEGNFHEFVHSHLQERDDDASSFLFEQSGGHAGLGARLVKQAMRRMGPTAFGLEQCGDRVANVARRLFEHWMAHFSEDARIVMDVISKHETGLSRREIAQILGLKDRDRFGAERVWYELQYVGVCRIDKIGRLSMCNELFWNYFQEFEPIEARQADVSTEVRRVRDEIKRVEVTLRELIIAKYRENWPKDEYALMKRVFGSDWQKIHRIYMRSKGNYPLSPGHERSLIECLTLGQLGMLIVNNAAWILFKKLFGGDKRWFQQNLDTIIRVRNDIDHSVQNLPTKEILRCEIACNDMLVILLQEVEDEGM